MKKLVCYGENEQEALQEWASQVSSHAHITRAGYRRYSTAPRSPRRASRPVPSRKAVGAALALATRVAVLVALALAVIGGMAQLDLLDKPSDYREVAR